MKSEPMVTVQVTATERVVYDKIIQISERAMEEYEAAVDRNEHELWFSEWADRYLDPATDIVDGSEYEDVQAERLSPTRAAADAIDSGEVK